MTESHFAGIIPLFAADVSIIVHFITARDKRVCNGFTGCWVQFSRSTVEAGEVREKAADNRRTIASGEVDAIGVEMEDNGQAGEDFL
jgi:hypothetical protein